MHWIEKRLLLRTIIQTTQSIIQTTNLFIMVAIQFSTVMIASITYLYNT